MARFVRFRRGEDAARVARAGLGTPWVAAGGRRVVATTIGNLSGTREPVAGAPEVEAGRYDRPAAVSGEMVAVSRVAFDLCARAACVAHGVGHEDAYVETRRGERSQGRGEAGGAIAVLEGLNVVVEDLVDAALLGASARVGLVADDVADEARGISALARLAVRAMADGEDAAGLARRGRALRAELDDLLALLAG